MLSPLRADGSIIWIQWITRGLFDDSGNLVEIQSTGRDVTEQRRAEQELEHHAEYQTIAADLSSNLLKDGPESIDNTIEAALSRIGEFQDLDFVSFRWRDTQGRWTQSHTWGRTGTPFRRGRALSEDEAGVSWPAQRMLRGEVIRFESLEDLPPEAAAFREYFEQLGIRSCILVPLLYRADLVGSIQAGTYGRSSSWTDQSASELQALGEIVSAAYTRSRAQAALLERETELAHSQKIAGVGSYFFFPKNGGYSSSPEFDAIQGLDRDSERSAEAWTRHLHPEDRARVLATFRNALERESGYASEYRFIRDDGTVLTLVDRGEIERDEHGNVERVCGTVLDVSEQRRIEVELTQALKELQTLKRQLEVENVYLREEARLAQGSDLIVGESPALQQCLQLVERVAPTDVTVLIDGETGTGKELIARTIHELSGREGPLVTVNCTVLPANLIESELFGHEKGAFTDAKSRKTGRLELAKRGTLFLDEIGELPLELQPKLLRALQEGEFERVGGVETLTFDGRVIAATNRDLEAAVAHGEFRPDLFFRLNVFRVTVPPLRARREDIPSLAKHFVAKHAGGVGREVKSISIRMLDHMAARDWPGNIRELESFVQRALIVGDGPVLNISPHPATPQDQPEQAPAGQGWQRLEDVERAHVLRVLGETGWAVEGEQGAARRLGLAPSTLRSRMKKLGIVRESDQSSAAGRRAGEVASTPVG